MYLQYVKAMNLQVMDAVYLQVVKLVLESELEFGCEMQTLENVGF